MEMRKCEKGHYYDASVNATCPYCNTGRNTEMTMAMGVAQPQMAAPSSAQAAGGFGGGGLEKTVAMGVNMPTAQEDTAVDNDRTVAMFQTSQGIDPVVGWLVRLNGSDKGKDYRIHSDNNFIGRGEKMDICLKGDDTISRENQAIITYDAAEKMFYFSPGEGRSVIRVNGKAILQTVELVAYDKVTIGKTELLFIPMCGEKFVWEEE